MRRALQIVALLCTLVVGAASVALIVSQTAWFKDWLRGFIVRQADNYLNADLSIRRLDGNLFFGVELEDIDLTMNGESVVAVKDIGIDYNVFALLTGAIALDDIRVNQPRLRLRRTQEGWNLGGLVKAQEREADREGPGRAISIGAIGISDGTLIVEDAVGTGGIEPPSRIERLNAQLAFEYEPVNYTVAIGHLSFRAPDRNFALNDLSGRIATEDASVFVDELTIRTAESALTVDGAVRDYQQHPTLDLRVASDKLVLEEIGRIVPALRGFGLQPAFDVSASGTFDHLRVQLQSRSEAGDIRADVVTDLTVPDRRIAGTVDVRAFNLAPLLKEPARRSDITGRAIVDLRLTGRTAPNPLAAIDGRYQVVAPRVAVLGYEARDVQADGRFDHGVLHVDGRAAAYGGRATVAGTITPGTPLRLDLRGRANGLDLRNLPPALKAPGAPSDLNVAYHIAGTPDDLAAEATFRQSSLAAATIEAGSTAGVTITGGSIAYRADATVRDLDLQRMGQAFGVTALTDARYASKVNGTFAVNGRGTGLQALVLDARGTLVDSTLFGGFVPRMAFETRVADQALAVKAQGAFSGFDPGALSGRENLRGELSGSLDVDASLPDLEGPFAPETMRVGGSVTLENSRIGEIAIDAARVEGTVEEGAGEIRSLSITGPDLRVEASGAVTVREGGASNLEYDVAVTSLETIGRMFGTEVSGTAAVEGRLTGNMSDLATTGTASASNLRYGGASILDASTKYDVRLPELDGARAEVKADTRIALAEIAGQEITEATAKTTWRGEMLDFDATVRDQQRTLEVAGDLTLHPDHQEVHVRNLALATKGVEWRTEPGSEGAVQYGANRIAVQNVRLTSGGQRLSVEGAYGQPGDRLIVRASAIDLAAVDRLALGEQRLDGTLEATATISGTREAPEVTAEFSIANGAFREFAYQDFGGTVLYGADGVRLDTRLNQAPGAWVTAKGFVPATFFKPGEGPPGHQEPAPGEGLDVAVTSSVLDLGIVQGFAPQVTSVSGSLQVDLRVTGSAADPHMEGFVDIRNGAFTVADLTKGGYTGLDTRITLVPDHVRIEEFTILDEHKRPLRVSGEIAVHERQIGDVQIAVKSDGFEVIDNQLADIKLNSDIRVTGQLRQPLVEGALSIHTGTIRLDRVLAQAASGAYAVEATTLETQPATPGAPDAAAGEAAPGLDALQPQAAPAAPPAAPPAAGEQEPEAPGLFDAMALDVRLAVPNNLVVRGTDLNPGGASPIGLGDVNVTLGGDLRVRKDRGGDIRLQGAVNTVRGSYDFQGRRFEIQRDGRIQFQGDTEINPLLDVTARRIISGVEVLVHVRGTARQPELTLSSRPPQDEADILSLILFNQPANALGEGQQISLAQRASALATGFVASSLAQSIGGALELDIFEIQTTPERGGSPTVTLGEQVGERLFFRFRQAFGAQSVSEFILEYQLADFLRLQTSIAEGGSATQRSLMQRVEQGGIDLIFFYSY